MEDVFLPVGKYHFTSEGIGAVTLGRNVPKFHMRSARMHPPQQVAYDAVHSEIHTEALSQCDKYYDVVTEQMDRSARSQPAVYRVIYCEGFKYGDIPICFVSVRNPPNVPVTSCRCQIRGPSGRD